MAQFNRFHTWRMRSIHAYKDYLWESSKTHGWIVVFIFKYLFIKGDCSPLNCNRSTQCLVSWLFSHIRPIYKHRRKRIGMGNDRRMSFIISIFTVVFVSSYRPTLANVRSEPLSSVLVAIIRDLSRFLWMFGHRFSIVFCQIWTSRIVSYSY